MKSIVVTKFGGPEVLELQDVPVPEPHLHEVLVEVEAAGINYADIMQRKGLYPGGPRPPFGAGFELAGVVAKVGEDVTQWKPGDAVMGFCQAGYSEFAIANQAALYAKPAQLDFSQAAAIPCQYLTAYHALITLGNVRPGQTVLVHAAAGGLGTMLVQIARNLGANVIGTCGSREKCALLREIGCAHPIQYLEHDFEEQVGQLTHHAGCDLIIESVGGEVFEKSLRCVKSRGMLIVLGVASGQPGVVDPLFLLMNSVTVAGFHLFAYLTDLQAMADAMRDLNGWLEAATLNPVVEYAFPLDNAAEAHQFISDRKSAGKVVLSVAE